MKQLFSFSLSILFAQLVFAQPKTNNANESIWIKNEQVWYKIQAYTPSILKLTMVPKNYSTTENISDAVILKPLPSVQKVQQLANQHHTIQLNNLTIEVKGDSIFLGHQLMLIANAKLKNNGYYGFQFQLKEGEQIFGGGERALPLNRRGYEFNLYNNPWYGYSEGADNLNYSVPFFTSNKGYALFFDNPSKGYVDIGKTNPTIFEAGFTSGELNVYIIVGKNYPAILQSYHQLTGTQPLPPRWALGNLMSRFGYNSEQQVKNIAAKMQTANIPVDAIIFDLFWFGDSIKSTMGNLEWVNTTAWPNPTKMIQDFKKNNIQTILITEPFVLKSSLNYSISKQFHAIDSNYKPYVLTDFYFGEGGIIDIFRNDAQQWFWSKHKIQMNKGVEAWWGDLGEPEKHPATVLHNLKDLGFKRLFKADEVHNLYGHTWTKMLFTNFAKDYPTKRLFSLNRSGFAGTQRYSIFPWTGDVSRSWSGLNAQLPILLGMSMSGVPYVHSDAGGFAGGNGDHELYVRWLQMAAFTPIFRPHGTALYEIDKNAFSFPSEAALIEEPYQSYAKKVIDLRYQLLPYNYNLAYLQNKFGKPLMMPLYYLNPTDSFATSIADQYYWGEQIIVAPILQKNSTQRSVYLPEHQLGYYKYQTNKFFEAGFINDTASLENQLIYVKAGSIIPTWQKPLGVNTSAYTTQQIVWQYYATNTNHTNTYSLYNDDGVTKNATSNFIDCYVKETNKNLTLQLSTTHSKKETLPSTIALAIIGLKKQITQVKVNNIVLAKSNWKIDTTTHLLSIHLKHSSNSVSITVE